MATKNKKPSIAIISLTCCEGCQVSILDKLPKFIELLPFIDIDEFRLIEDEKLRSKYDITFIEGNPLTYEQIKEVKHLRKISGVVATISNCAALGGVWELKNYGDKNKTIRHIYKKDKTIDNPDVCEISRYIDVDYEVPGCPINADDFYELVYCLLAGKKWQLPNNPVCYECQINNNECLLQKGEICLGPITLGGCNAVCLNSKQACWGCRGNLKGMKKGVYENFYKILKSQGHSDKDIKMTLESFGMRDNLEEQVLGMPSRKECKK